MPGIASSRNSQKRAMKSGAAYEYTPPASAIVSRPKIHKSPTISIHPLPAPKPASKCGTCNRFGHTEADCFLTHPKILAAFLEKKPDHTQYWAEKVKGYEASLKISMICNGCSRRGHVYNNCYTTNSKAREEYLKGRPAERNYWEAQAKDYNDYLIRKARREEHALRPLSKATDKTSLDNIQCFHCGEYGHYKYNCDKPEGNGMKVYNSNGEAVYLSSQPR
ncbi:hypothetical protein B0O99DRAFT_680923 [Bisporella sp. PMI_857]|nr:hypothetical protein B0O99DRAFT_680923 [Bisporella sp. PMI_857]